MAAIARSFKQDATPTAIGEEVFMIDMDVDTSIVITPSKIKAIESVYWAPTNAAAATAATTNRADAFMPGQPTITFESAATATFVLVVRGTIA